MAEAVGAMPLIKPAVPNAGATQAPAPGGDPSKQAAAANAQVKNAPFQIQGLGAKQPYIKMLVYGKHGAGKTLLAATASDLPQMSDVLLISAESGQLTLQGSTRLKNPDSIDMIPVTTFKTVARIQEFLKTHCVYRDADNIEGLRKLQSFVTGVPIEEITTVRKYRTVILDSLTEIESYCMYSLLNIAVDKIADENIDVAQFAEFRKQGEMVKLLVRAFRDLPMNVIFVCAEAYSQDERKAYHYSPAMTGKLASQIQGFMDVVGWLVVGPPTEGQEAPRRLYVQPVGGGPKFDAKNRLASVKESFFDNPTMRDILSAAKMLK